MNLRVRVKAVSIQKVMDVRHVMLLLCSLIVMLCLFQSCSKDKCQIEQTYIEYQGIYASLESIRQPIQALPPREIKQLGKIYTHKNCIFINEPHKGVHVYDISTAASPKAVAFYDIPGNVRLWLHDDIMVADHYMDLVYIDISDVAAPKTVQRVEEAIEDVYEIDAERGIIVDWSPTLVSRKGACDTILPNVYLNHYGFCGVGVPEPTPFYYNNGKPTYANKGIGFAQKEQHLYIKKENTIKTFTVGSKITLTGKTTMPDAYYFGGNSINVFGDYLCAERFDKLRLLSLTNSSNPSYLTDIEDFIIAPTACYDEKLLYNFSTTRDFTTTPTTTLDVISMNESTRRPFVERSFEMFAPMGMVATDKHLVVADIDLLFYEKSTENVLELVDRFTPSDFLQALIAVTDENVLIAKSQNDLILYDIANTSDVQELGRINL